ncbi:MAG: phenylalanine--tRNA ligase beta subunit-related protein [Methanocellales archaeon]|nr:phenylalanine--tRNA ligase beta subunit-related protein [Methanocellales archaeon]
MITIHPSVLSKFDLGIRYSVIKGVRVEEESDALERFKETVADEIRKKYTLETIKDEDIFRKYRDFFWQLGIDPTKKRPAAEALTRRILQGKPIPRVSTLVDSYNLASIKTGVPMGAFDLDRLDGVLTLRFAKEDEFIGIGMSEPVVIKDALVVSDEKKLIAIYPYRDADATKITLRTKNVFLLVCGVPGVDEETLEKAKTVAEDIITTFCGGISHK